MTLRDTLLKLAEPDLSGDPAIARDFDAAVGPLLDRMQAWLSDLVDQGRTRVHPTTSVLHEDGYHPREVRKLDIETDGARIEVVPVGALVVGAAGRVDMRRADGDGPELRLLWKAGGADGWKADWKGEGGLSDLGRATFIAAVARVGAGSENTTGGGAAVA